MAFCSSRKNFANGGAGFFFCLTRRLLVFASVEVPPPPNWMYDSSSKEKHCEKPFLSIPLTFTDVVLFGQLPGCTGTGSSSVIEIWKLRSFAFDYVEAVSE